MCLVCGWLWHIIGATALAVHYSGVFKWHVTETHWQFTINAKGIYKTIYINQLFVRFYLKREKNQKNFYPNLTSNAVCLGLNTWEYWGLFQLTGTSTLELEPDEVEDALRVTVMARGFPSRPAEFWSSSYRLPMMGVLRKWKRTDSSDSNSFVEYGTILPRNNQKLLLCLKLRSEKLSVTKVTFLMFKYTSWIMHLFSSLPYSLAAGNKSNHLIFNML